MQCVKLVFTRSMDDITQQYIVYRGVGDGARIPAYIIEHPEEPNPIEMKDDLLVNDAGVYRTTYGNIIKERGIVVTVDGEPVTPVAVDYASGTVVLDPAPEPAAVVKADYWFDGIIFIDTSIPHEGVTPLTGPAIDRTPPQAVVSPRLKRDAETGLVRLEYDAPPASSGTRYHYHVVAADRFGNRSWPSPVVEAVLTHNLNEVPFIIERSTDEGLTWDIVDETADFFFLDEPRFTGPMAPVENLTGEFQTTEGAGQVILSWEPPQASDGKSAMYRIRTRSALNAISDPTPEIGPVSIERVAVEYRIYRGSELIGTTTEFTFTDADIELDTSYTYRVTAVDVLGNESEGMEVEVAVGDSTPSTEVE